MDLYYLLPAAVVVVLLSPLAILWARCPRRRLFAWAAIGGGLAGGLGLWLAANALAGDSDWGTVSSVGTLYWLASGGAGALFGAWAAGLLAYCHARWQVGR